MHVFERERLKEQRKETERRWRQREVLSYYMWYKWKKKGNQKKIEEGILHVRELGLLRLKVHYVFNLTYTWF